MTLFEVFHYKKPSISHLQLFGRKCFIHILEEPHLPKSKLMPQAEEGILVVYTDTPSIYKVHIPARSNTFIVSTLNVMFEDTSAISKIITSDETIPDVNSDNGLTSAISISFARPITHLMADSQQQLIQPQQPPQQFSQPPQTTAVIIPSSLPDSQYNQYIYLDYNYDEQVMICLDKYNDVKQHTHIDTEQELTSYN